MAGDEHSSGGGGRTSGASAVQDEIAQRRPFHSLAAEVAVGILRTAALIERHFGQIVARRDITVQQYNVLRILRGMGATDDGTTLYIPRYPVTSSVKSWP